MFAPLCKEKRSNEITTTLSAFVDTWLEKSQRELATLGDKRLLADGQRLVDGQRICCTGA
jgi:hypothetical protein